RRVHRQRLGRKLWFRGRRAGEPAHDRRGNRDDAEQLRQLLARGAGLTASVPALVPALVPRRASGTCGAVEVNEVRDATGGKNPSCLSSSSFGRCPGGIGGTTIN